MSSLPSLSSSSFTPFAKPIDGIRNQTNKGAIITLIAAFSASLLFLAQLLIYLEGDSRQAFTLTPSHPLSIILPTDGSYANFLKSSNNNNQNRQTSSSHSRSDRLEAMDYIKSTRLTISVHITFPFISCHDLSFTHDSVSSHTGEFYKRHGRNAFSKRIPTEYEWAVVTNKQLKKTNHPHNTVAGGRSPQAHYQRYGKKTSTDKEAKNACTITGSITVPRIRGDLAFHVTPTAWNKALSRAQIQMKTKLEQELQNPSSSLSSSSKDNSNKFRKKEMYSWSSIEGLPNVSHYIHDISFGEHFPLAKNPLSNAREDIDNGSGVGITNFSVKLIPTNYKRTGRRYQEYFQASVTKHFIQPETLAAVQSSMFPGVLLHYDFTPIAVHHVESRENFLIFISSVISIVGGVFVTVRLVTGFLVDSATAVAKKMD